MTVVTILNHFDYITIEGLEKMVTEETYAQGFTISFRRLVASGLFRDPNDLCVLLATVTVPTFYLFMCDKNIFLKPVWLACLILFAYGMNLTSSRGGLLAISGAVAAALYFRIGWQRFLLIAVVAAPFIVSGLGVMLLDRRVLSNTRIQLWSDWMTRFRENPIFGEGMNLTDETKQQKAYNPEEDFHLAHNSYIQAFADRQSSEAACSSARFLLANWSLARISFHGSVVGPRARGNASVRRWNDHRLQYRHVYAHTLLLHTYGRDLGISTAYRRMAPTNPSLYLFNSIGLSVVSSYPVFLGAMYIFLRIFLRWA